MDNETPRLIIKFTQNIASNCIEIVPQISCTQNLDKIELNKETHVIEYTIPMTHKIKLEKDLRDEEYIDEEKTYHSCVDLIDNCSIAESGKNLIRILSDNKMVSHYINEDIVAENKTKLAVKENKDVSDGTSEHLTVYIDAPSNQSLKDNRYDKSTNSDSDVNTIISELYKDAQIDFKNKTKISSDIESKEELFGIIQHSSTETNNLDYEKRLTMNSVYSFSTNPESDTYNKKLSMSPVYSMSAGESEYPIITTQNSKMFVCPVHSVPARCELKIKNNEFEDVKQLNQKTVNLPNGKFSRFNCYYKDRIPLDVKLAYYRQLMEKEVSPLKTTLNNILQKCMALGVHEQLRKAANKSVDNDLTKCAIDKRQSYIDVVTGEPNRVVYDFVFDD